MGEKGQLIAIEPIPAFAEVWKKNMKRFSADTVQLLNIALGNEAQENVKMSIPMVNGVVRHGLTKVSETKSKYETYLEFEVPMKIGDSLFEGEKYKKIDFIKCDVEGYEQYVVPSLNNTLVKYKPTIQIELSGVENKQNVTDYLVGLGYEIFKLQNNLLSPVEIKDIFNFGGDFYFIHKDKLEEKKHLINN